MSSLASIFVTPVSALIPVPSDLIGKVWDVASPYLKQALDESAGDYTLGDVRRFLDSADAQLWVIYQDGIPCGAMTTRITAYPTKPVCEFWLYAGALPSNFAELLGEVETWARELGCSRLRINGRRGWARKLGWTERSTVADKCL